MALSNQKTSLFFRLSLSVTVFSALFKFMPPFLLLLGALGMIVFLGIQLYQQDKRAPLDYTRLVLILAFSMNYIFNLFGSPFVGSLTLLTKFALISFLILYIRKIIILFQDFIQNNGLLLGSFAREDLSFILADLATVYIVIASLFKILDWEIGVLNGNLLLIIGLITAVISILASSRELGK